MSLIFRKNKYKTDRREVDKLPTDYLQSHVHPWELVAKTYAPAIRSSYVNDDKIPERILFGVTSFLWECPICKAFRREELLGTDSNPFSDIFQKVDSFGPQIVSDQDQSYVLSKYIPPAQQPGNIPLR